MSTGIFKTTKMIMMTPDVVKNDSTDRQPLYNSITGRETLNKMKMVLNFNSTVAIQRV